MTLSHFVDVCQFQVIAEFAGGGTAQCQNAFGNFVHLFGYVVVHLFKLAVENEELGPLDVPVETAEVGVINLKSANNCCKELTTLFASDSVNWINANVFIFFCF